MSVFCITKGSRLYNSHSTPLDVFFLVFSHSHVCWSNWMWWNKWVTSLLQKPLLLFARFHPSFAAFNIDFSMEHACLSMCMYVCMFGTYTSADNNVLMNMHSLIYDSFYKIWNDFVFVLLGASLSLSAFWRDVSGNEWTNSISMVGKKGRKYFISPFKSPLTCKTNIKHFLLEQFFSSFLRRENKDFLFLWKMKILAALMDNGKHKHFV